MTSFPTCFAKNNAISVSYASYPKQITYTYIFNPLNASKKKTLQMSRFHLYSTSKTGFV